MIWYYYLAYRIYVFYRKRDNIPVFFSFSLLTTLVNINIMTVAIFVQLINPYFQNYNKFYALIPFTCIGIINYLILYRRYEVIFNKFDLDMEHYKKYDLSVKIYFTITVALFIISLVLVDGKNQGYL
jgi:purine-cytosine permease-like protein